MKLQKIRILNYKSIKESIEIPFTNEGGIVTFIGKNGSGKTNILQAMRKSIIKQAGYYNGGKETIRSQYTLKVSKEDKEKYFSSVNVEKCEDEIVVDFTNGEEHIKKVQAPILTVSVGQYKEKLEKLFKRIKNAGKNYVDKLKGIEQKFELSYYPNMQIVDEKDRISFLDSYKISYIENEIKRQIEEIREYLLSTFEKEYITIGDHLDYSRRFMPFREIEFYQIASNKNIRVSSILAKSLGLNKEDVEKVNEKLNNEINKINKQLKTEYAILTDCLKEFNKIKEEIYDIFYEQEEKSYEIQERIDNEYKQFCRLLKDSIYRIGYYIDNEETLLFFNKNDGYNRREFLNEYLNAKNPIWEAIHQFLLEQNYYKEEESILELDKIEESRLKYLEKKINKEFLSSLVSGFDKDEILGYRIAFNNKNVSIFVKEKSGEEIDINSTSLGRRWFLTYSFVKRLLKKGDFLFIDEPAAFLHPQAQIEFRKDLEQLASNGVYVFITTHSPYMIPNNWANVHNVIMTEKGTQVQSFIDKDELCETIKEELGISRTSDILFNLSKTILLVEGVADKACIEKFARKLGYDLSNYHILPCNGSSIIGLTYLCIREKIKFKALLDADNKNKPKEWLNRQFGYKEYLEVIKNNKDCIFTPEDGARKCLEDCFSLQDTSRYFYEKKNLDGSKEKKIDFNKIEAGEVFTDETLKNFEQLFIKLGIPKIDKK